MGRHPLNRFIDSFQRMVKGSSVFKHRPLNGVTFNPISDGNIKSIIIRRKDDEIKGVVKLRNREVSIIVEKETVKFGNSESYHIDDKPGLTHFLTILNSTI